MIDYSNDIFNYLAKNLRRKFNNITVVGENIDIPSSFPCVTLDEVSNIPTSVDWSDVNKLAHIRYRVQVFSNKQNGKRQEAREIYKYIDELMQNINLTCKTYSPLPDVYNSKIYQITSSYDGVIRNDGFVFKQ